MFGRNKIAMIVAEFLGTFVLTSAIYAALLERLPTMFVASTAAITLGLMILVIGQTSGSHLNPAVTISMWTLRKIETTRAVVYIAAQFLGAVAAWQLAEYWLKSDLKTITVTTFDWRVLSAEVVGSVVFAFGLASTLFQGFKGLRQAVAVGAAFGIAILIASTASNAVLNPAVALGIRSWNFSYVAGPVLGGIVGVNLYAMLFADRPKKVKAAKTTAKKSVAKKTTKKRK